MFFPIVMLVLLILVRPGPMLETAGSHPLPYRQAAALRGRESRENLCPHRAGVLWLLTES